MVIVQVSDGCVSLRTIAIRFTFALFHSFDSPSTSSVACIHFQCLRHAAAQLHFVSFIFDNLRHSSYPSHSVSPLRSDLPSTCSPSFRIFGASTSMDFLRKQCRRLRISFAFDLFGWVLPTLVALPLVRQPLALRILRNSFAFDSVSYRNVSYRCAFDLWLRMSSPGVFQDTLSRSIPTVAFRPQVSYRSAFHVFSFTQPVPFSIHLVARSCALREGE
jgi:hypothetical protein